MGQPYLLAAQEVALKEIAVVPRLVFIAGAGNKYSEIIFQRVSQIGYVAVRIYYASAELRIVMPMSSCHFPLGTPTRINPSL